MEDPVYIPIHEIILKSEKESGNFLVLKEYALAESSLIMFVGEPEFIAIAKEKGLIETPRPLTLSKQPPLISGTYFTASA